MIETARERYVLRDEIFGGTLFDRKSFGHKFVDHHEIQRGIVFNGTTIANYEKWGASLENVPTNIPFSPVRVYFELTRKCNLDCQTCFNSSGLEGPNEMNTDEVKRCLEGMRADNIFDIRFTGGEVTVRPDWFELFQHAKAIGFAFSVNTSGVYDDPETIDKLAFLNPDQITISIDGNEEHHDRIRGKGNFQRSIQTLQELKKQGAILRTNTVLTKLSLQDAEEIAETVGEYVDEMAFFHMRATGRAKTKLIKELVDFDELAEFNRHMESVSQNHPDINFYYGERVVKENSILPGNHGMMMGRPDGFTRFNLLADGSLWAGGYAPYIDRTLNLGNMKDEGYSLLKVWRESEKLKWFRDFSNELFQRCLGCPEFEKRCPGVNVEMELIRLKSPKMGNPYCIY